MKNKYKPFFYQKERTPFSKILLSILFTAVLLILFLWQIPRTRQIIAEPLYAAGSLLYNAARDFFDSTRMYHEPEKKPQIWTPLELPDKEVLFAESLENLSSISQEDPLADLRQTPTPSEYSRVAEWEFLDPNMNYELNYGSRTNQDDIKIDLIPPVFERADLFNDGPAILSAALRYWGIIENQYRIAQQIHPDSMDPDCNFSEMQLYVQDNHSDFSGIIRINGDKDLLKYLLQKGFPVIIRITYKTPYSFWLKDDRLSACYLLVLGYDSESDIFVCQDTITSKTKQIAADELMASWYPYQRTYFIIYPEERDSDIREVLNENYYEELNLQQAESKFRTDSSILGDNPFAQYNYGLVLHRTGDNAGAMEYFQKAADNLLPQRYLFYQKDILETMFELGMADDMDNIVIPVLRHNSHDEVLTVYRGWADILRGDYKSGAEKFEKAGRINPNNELVRYALRYSETLK